MHMSTESFFTAHAFDVIDVVIPARPPAHWNGIVIISGHVYYREFKIKTQFSVLIITLLL